MSDAEKAPLRIGTNSTKTKKQHAIEHAVVAPPEAEKGHKQQVVSLRAVEEVKAKPGQTEFDCLQLQFKTAKRRF